MKTINPENLLSEKQSRECYAAAFRALQNGRHGADLIFTAEFGAQIVPAGIRGDLLVFENMELDAFGDWKISETTEDQFVDGCMEAFGNVSYR